MSLGVLNNIAAIYAQNNLNNTQNSLQNTLTQLSSGSRINTGADDAAGLAVADGLHANVAALTQSAQNATNGIGLLQTADGALSQVTNLLNRAVTLATESANTTLSTSQVSSANAEYTNILAEIGNIGATTNFNGNNVFTNTSKTIFVSDGTASGSNSYQDVVGALTTHTVGQSAPTGLPAAITVGAAGTTSGAVVRSTSSVTLGSSTDTVSGNLVISVGGGAAITIAGGGATGTAFAAAITANASAVAQGISASYTGSVLTLSGPASGNGTLIIGGTSSLVTSTGSAAVTPTAPTTGSTGASTVTITPVGPTDTFSGTITLAVGTGGAAHSITIGAGTGGSALANAINNDATYQTAQISAAVNAITGAVTISGPTGTGHDLNTTGTSITGTPGPGVGVDFTATTIATLSATSAQNVLTSVTTAIGNVAYQRGIIGANINELSAASGVASSESVNLTSAESAIRSTDYGTATSALAKFKVLSQTGISALAQANSVQQEVTKLLQ